MTRLFIVVLAAGAISIAACDRNLTDNVEVAENRADAIEERTENRAELIEEHAANRAEAIREAGQKEAEAIRDTVAE